MNSGSAASTDYELYANWLPTGVWQGTLSGFYIDYLNGQGGEGNYWSSTANGTGNAFVLSSLDDYVAPGNYEAPDGWWAGLAVRCAI